MRRNKIDEKEFLRIANELGVEYSDVKSAVISFFDAIVKEADKLPFDNPNRIYKKDKFAEYEKVWSIPYIGRIGTSYSRYLKWRANEAKGMEMAKRSDYRTSISQEDIEKLAKQVLEDWKEGDEKVGKIPIQRLRSYPFKRVWMIDKEKKKQARQVIPKKKCSK